MSDKGKREAIATLRTEVGFGCPVCRNPFLTWHHFDPPWHKEQHWRTEGIIALCGTFHDDADEKGENAGAYSIDGLRRLKNSRRSAEDVKAHFPTWQDKESLLVRLGGCYTDTLTPIISINEVPQITLGKNAEGLLTLSFELRNKDDGVLLRMEDNWLTAYPAKVHDMIVPPKTKTVKVWLDEDDVGLEFSFNRITMADLDELLRQDFEKALKIGAEREREFMATLSPEDRKCREEMLRISQSMPRHLPPGAEERLPEAIRECFFAEDKTGCFVKRWVKDNCLMDDGLIPFLNFEQMAIYTHGHRFMIKDGVANFAYYCSAFKNGKGTFNLPCPCPDCSPRIS